MCIRLNNVWNLLGTLEKFEKESRSAVDVGHMHAVTTHLSLPEPRNLLKGRLAYVFCCCHPHCCVIVVAVLPLCPCHMPSRSCWHLIVELISNLAAPGVHEQNISP